MCGRAIGHPLGEGRVGSPATPTPSVHGLWSPDDDPLHLRLLLDQDDCLGRDLRFPGRRVRFPLPKQAEALVLRVQHRLRLDDEQCLAPAWQPAHEQDEKRAINARAMRSFDRTVAHDKLLAQQQVFSNQWRFAASKVTDGAKDWGRQAGLGPA